jgi:hypothetical protein
MVSPLVEGTNGNFYAVTPLVDNLNDTEGGILEFTHEGTLITAEGFLTPVMPTTPLLSGSDGNFYATTLQGGTNGYGTAYKIAPSLANNTFSFYSFSYTNGAFPDSDLIESPDGSLYGTASTAGGLGGGNIYQLYQVVTNAPSLLSAGKNQNVVTLVWSAMTGRNYQVQYSTDLTSGIWNSLNGPSPATNTTMVTLDPTATDSARFYRIQMQ